MRFIAAVLLSVSLPGLAMADGAMPTAPPAQPQPAMAPAAPLLDADDAQAVDGPTIRAGPCGPQMIAADGRADTKAHGYVDVGVGTRGYRHIAAGVCKPLAGGGAIAVSVSDTQIQGRRR
jgi:hypothetical protein